MNLLNSNLNKVTLLIISTIFFSIVGIADYFTGSEISLLLFYLIPIFFLSLHKNSSKKLIVINSIIGGMVWFFSEYYSRKYTYDIIPAWNAMVRLFIFLIFGLLLRLLNERLLKLEVVNKQLEQLNLEKNRFIGIAAHDIKNPIGTISSFSDLLISDFSGKMETEVAEIIGYIKELSSNSLHILKNILDVSKIESGIIEIKTKKQDYISFIKKQIFYNRLLAKKKDIRLIFESSFVELIYDFDENHLGEVISNLLTNAIKFSNKNADIIIKVSITNDHKLKTEIIDFGKGIHESEHYKLFNYFQKTTTQPTDGELSTGLGLAISKKIIMEHKGFIDFKSELNKGSNFYFEI
ncbi:sensor histidine kinase [Flavobacterium sp.]